MTDRLKEIWSGFSGTTERRLTGKGVDNIIVPHRADFDGTDERFLPDDYESPAERAFAALRADLAGKEKKFARRKDKRAATEEVRGPAPGADADEKKWGSDDLNMGLWSTAMRVERSDLDYAQFLSSPEGKRTFRKAKKARKKFLGIF